MRPTKKLFLAVVVIGMGFTLHFPWSAIQVWMGVLWLILIVITSRRKTAVVTRYVVGLMFNPGMNTVALIRKNKPAWQAGLLNGIGGKIEDGESPSVAMVREFKEEAGLLTEFKDWNLFCEMRGVNNDGGAFEIHFFFALGDLNALKSQEAEQLEIHTPSVIAFGNQNTIGNLPWLVALALDFGKGVHPPGKVTAEYFPKLAARPEPRHNGETK